MRWGVSKLRPAHSAPVAAGLSPARLPSAADRPPPAARPPPARLSADMMSALGESVSFGQFLSEPLEWGKWSVFAHNRYLEEVAGQSRPGSVAQNSGGGREKNEVGRIEAAACAQRAGGCRPVARPPPADRPPPPPARLSADMMSALGESVSFGRFLSEPLEWGKWSAFAHNRYLEEAAGQSRPGSVAQKKAFFEAHYTKKRTSEVDEDDEDARYDLGLGAMDGATASSTDSSSPVAKFQGLPQARACPIGSSATGPEEGILRGALRQEAHERGRRG